MPRKPPRPCSHRGCPHLVRGDRRFCDEHQADEWKRQDAGRATSARRGYGAEWQEIRARFLESHPLCAHCGRPAAVAHHIVRKRDGGSDDESNLIALCQSCHSALHARVGESFG